MDCICIACKRKMDNLMSFGLQPVDGIAFISPGHYGTSVFDPMDGSKLEIVVCDDCVVKAGKKGLVVLQKPGDEMPEIWKPTLAAS